MTTTNFDALEVDRELKAATADREEVVTKADLHRALWVQGAAIVGMVGGLIAIAASLQLFS